MAQMRMHSRYGFHREEEEREKRKYQRIIIEKYYEFIKTTPDVNNCHTDKLPHPKNEIVEALLNCIANAKSIIEIDHAAISIMTLANFQEFRFPDISSKILEAGASCVDDLSAEQVEEIFSNIDIGSVSKFVAAHARDVSEFRQWVIRAKSMNPHILPWYVKIWHRLRQQGAYSRLAKEHVTIR